MNDDPNERMRGAIRATLAELQACGRVKSLSDWCRHADLHESTLRMFLKGASKSLTVETCGALARAADVPIGVIIGEVPFPPTPAPAHAAE